MKFVEISNGSITMSVPEADVDFYARAGYERVKEKPAKAEKPEKPGKADKAPVEEVPVSEEK